MGTGAPLATGRGWGQDASMPLALPPHALEADPDEGQIPPYPAPLSSPLPPHLQGNKVLRLYLELAPEYEAEFSRMAAADAQDD